MRRIITAVTVVFFAAACSGSDKETGPEAVTLADLVGSWTAASLAYTDNANPAQQFDLIAAGGENRVTVLPGGGARTWLDIGTFSDEWEAQLSISGDMLTSTPVEASRAVQRWTFSLDGDLLELTDTASEFDFTLADGEGIPATVVVVLVRN
ncbi:MAG: hypothetical protein PVJ04_06890 [Gemmatimonadota bacterium]|jgi:hypothetical protein